MNAQKGKQIAVWGSPGAGKSVTAVKLALAYEAAGHTCALVFCDQTTPMLPCVLPDEQLTVRHSLGSLFAAKEVIPALVSASHCEVADHEKLHLYGFLRGEHKTDYPPVSERLAEEFLTILETLYEVVIVDLACDVFTDPLSMVGLRSADDVVRLMSCELKSISYYAAWLPYLESLGVDTRYFYRTLSKVSDPAFAEKLYRKSAYQLPYTEELEQQMMAGNLFQELVFKQSRGYNHVLESLAKELWK